MRTLPLAALATILASAAPAVADAPPAAVARPIGHRSVARLSYRVAIRAERRRGGYGFVVTGGAYGVEPPYFPGTGAASPSDGSGGAAVELSQYREAYIGRGLVYNVPPQPFLRSAGAINVRY